MQQFLSTGRYDLTLLQASWSWLNSSLTSAAKSTKLEQLNQCAQINLTVTSLLHWVENHLYIYSQSQSLKLQLKQKKGIESIRKLKTTTMLSENLFTGGGKKPQFVLLT